MTDNEQENITEKSFKIPMRRENGIAGPSREVFKTDAASLSADRAGRENNDDVYRGEDEPFNPVRDVIRKTELLGWDVRSAHRSRWKTPVEPEEDPDNLEEER